MRRATMPDALDIQGLESDIGALANQFALPAAELRLSLLAKSDSLNSGLT